MQNPEDLYLRLCALQGTHIDRCMLHVFRCAVYYASNDSHDPERLKWKPGQMMLDPAGQDLPE